MNDREHFDRGGNLNSLGIAHMKRTILRGKWARRKAIYLDILRKNKAPKEYNKSNVRLLIKTMVIISMVVLSSCGSFRQNMAEQDKRDLERLEQFQAERELMVKKN